LVIRSDARDEINEGKPDKQISDDWNVLAWRGTMREKKYVYNLNNARMIYSAIKHAGIDFVAYVPETWTREILKLILQDTDIESVNATGEAEAMAIAAGASLGGKTPMVLMEGSEQSLSVPESREASSTQ
jgi:hypothetical protein